MRVEDDHKYRGDNHGLYIRGDPLEDLREFLDSRTKRFNNDNRDDNSYKKSRKKKDSIREVKEKPPPSQKNPSHPTCKLGQLTFILCISTAKI
jgi:hypothetical protein